MRSRLLVLALVGCGDREPGTLGSAGLEGELTVSDEVQAFAYDFGEVPDAIRQTNSAWCWVTLDRELFAVGLDDQALYRSAYVVQGGHDMAFWRGGFYTVGNGRGLRRVESSGATSSVPGFTDGLGARGVSLWNQGLAVLGTDRMVVFDTPAAVMAHAGIEVALEGTPSVTRMAIEGDRAYGAWHSIHEVEVFDVTSGVVDERIQLEDFDGPVDGIDVVEGRLVVASPMRSLLVFDLQGRRLDEIPLGQERPEGLWCEDRGAR